MINKTLANRYTLDDVIGHGGMADVYVGKDTRLGRKVAIKILKSELAYDPVFLARFRREAQASASLNHPNIVAVYDTGEEVHRDENGQDVHIPYIVMEYVDGRTLRSILQLQKRLPQDDCAEIVLGVLSALEYSHKIGIIHRDIKPANVMIAHSGMVKVMDFGIARAMADSAATMTQSQGVVGTAQYLSPEQARGEVVDFRSDLYAVGCLLFELLTGRPPFVGDSPVSIAYQHVRELPPKASEHNDKIGIAFDLVVDKALQKDVNLRYSNAHEFAIDLRNAVKGQAPAIVAEETKVFTTEELNDMKNVYKANKNTPKKISVQNRKTPAFEDTFAKEDNNSDQKISPEQRYNQSFGSSSLEHKKEVNYKAIAFTTVAIIVVLIIALMLYFTLSKNQSEQTRSVDVPVMSTGISQEDACSLIEERELVCKFESDKDSNEKEGTVTKIEPAAGTSVNKGTIVKIYVSGGPQIANVPVLKNMTEIEAKSSLEAAGFTMNAQVKSVDCKTTAGATETQIELIQNACSFSQGVVVGTIPSSGEQLAKGTQITVYKSSGQVQLPDLSGKSKEQINAVLDELGLTAKFDEVSDSSKKENLAFEQTPAAGKVPQKSIISVKIAVIAKVTIPLITGKSLAVALALLESAGLEANVIYDSSSRATADNDGNVKSVVPDEGTSVDPNKKITIEVYKAKESTSSDTSDTDTSTSSSKKTTKK